MLLILPQTKMNEIPNELYRGVVASQDRLSDIITDSVILRPTIERVDSQGRKVVGDGNEYGLYMSDRDNVAVDVYGNPREVDLPDSPQFGFPARKITIPQVGVVYKIDPEKAVNVRRPQLYMPYAENNSFIGNEWICDEVPVGAYKVIRVRIAQDFLHYERDMKN